MNKTFIAIALISPLIIAAPTEAAPQQNQQQKQLKKKNKVSQNTALRRCNLSVQEKYSHYARYCSMLKPSTIARRQNTIVNKPIEVSYAYGDDDSAAAFFTADRARMKNMQVAQSTNQPRTNNVQVARRTNQPRTNNVQVAQRTNQPRTNNVQVAQRTNSTVKIKQASDSIFSRTRSFGTPEPLRVAKQWEGYHAQRNRSELRNLLTKGNQGTIDPVKIPWCAAFANAILKQTGREGTGSLQARSFLGYGIATKYPREGDIAVFSRGRNRAAGHVGFYMGETIIDGVKYILVLGGNQNKEVNVTHYPASRLLGFRSLG
jgi:uncharacterized protein (TIGR02594 family)